MAASAARPGLCGILAPRTPGAPRFDARCSDRKYPASLNLIHPHLDHELASGGRLRVASKCGFYVGPDGSTQWIGMAVSADGVTWTTYTSNPILDVGANRARDPNLPSQVDVLLVGRPLGMWYSGNSSGTDWQTGLATIGRRGTREMIRP